MVRRLKVASSSSTNKNKNDDSRANNNNNNKTNSNANKLYIVFVLMIIWTFFTLILHAFDASKWSTTEVLLLFSNIYNQTSNTRITLDDHFLQQPRIRDQKKTTNDKPMTTTMKNDNNEISEEDEEETTPPLIKPVICDDHKPSTDPNIGRNISSKFVEKTTPNFWISLHTRYFDLLRWNSIMTKGEYYETGLTKQFQQILKDQPPGLVVDVGMNIGWFTLYSRAMGHNVIGFDPNPIMHSRVCESLKLNGWYDDSTVELLEYGLGDHVATLNLTTGKNPGMSSFHEDRLAPKFRKKIVVPVTTLDILAKQKGWLSQSKQELKVHLLKVDVEGYEPYVFRGATKLISSGIIQNIIMENSVTDLMDVSEMFILLAQSNYRIHMLSNVNGDRFHDDLIESTNEALDNFVVRQSATTTTNNTNRTTINELSYFASSSMNVWWKLRPS